MVSADDRAESSVYLFSSCPYSDAAVADWVVVAGKWI